MKKFLKNYGVEIIFVVIFLLASVIYCSPVLDGKIIYAGDGVNGAAATHESVQYTKETGDYSFWTGALFCGMPNYQIGGGRYASSLFLRPFIRFFNWGLRNDIFLVFFYLVAFYILLRTFEINKWMSLAGAFAIAFSSYFFIIIAVQHHGKCISITWMTMVLVGFLLTFKKRYGWGAIFTMLFVAIGFFTHPQMSYYVCMLIGVLYFAVLYEHIKEKRLKDLGIGTVLFAAAFAIGMGCGSANIFANTEYAEQTMRGGHSDLVKDMDAKNKTKGLDLDYATAWSYGIDECMTFMIPNYMGGASGYNVGTDSKLYQDMVNNGVHPAQAKEFCKQAPTYRGEQPFTDGPVYMGAIVCFFFILGLFIVKGPYKWALLVATLFSVLLSLGHNFMPLTEFFFKYFPMYNKFRAVSSILIIAEITMPLLGLLAIRDIINKEMEPKKILRWTYISVGITAGICLIFALLGGSLLDFTSTNDQQFVNKIPVSIYNAILAQRASMLQSDALRSFILILCAACLVVLLIKEKIKVPVAGIILTVLVLIDMWPVDKRFFNDDDYVAAKKLDQAFVMEPYEAQLLKDKSDFRVLNLSTNTFNEARTSYYLKSIGGYSAAKLRRYQDMIDVHISKEMNPLLQSIAITGGNLAACNADSIFPVLNMLNMKYAIVQLKNGEITTVENPHAMGNAWFVDTLMLANTPNEECDALRTINLHSTAVLDKQFADFATQKVTAHDSLSKITLTKYTPKYVEYTSESSTAKTAVFSEIYYPFGWKATIDGKPADHFRANYTLRAMNIPAGKHDIRFEFNPDSVTKGNRLSVACISVMYLTMLVCAGIGTYRGVKRRRNTTK